MITGEKSTLEIAAILISIGISDNTDYLRGVLPLDAGYVITNNTIGIEVAGIFVAGNIRLNSAQQVITAAGDDVTATIYAEKFLSG